MKGIELMLNQMLKNMGINPEDIGKLASFFESGITSLQKDNAAILKNQRAIMRHLDIPFVEPEENDGQPIDNGSSGEQRTGTDG